MKTITHTTHYNIYTYDELCDADRQLIDEAKHAALDGYAPYSRFQVGAAALLSDGIVVTGNNQENVAYPSGICAERTALFYANAAHPHKAVKAIAIAAYSNGKYTNSPIPPCGACRQVMLEAEHRYGTKIRLLLYGTEATYIVEGGIGELLPLTFDATLLT